MQQLRVATIGESTIIYQTGCWYKDHGQIIIAQRIDATHIRFVDITRGIWGEMECDLNAYNIHSHYLNDAYGHPKSYELVKDLETQGFKNMHLVPTWRPL